MKYRRLGKTELNVSVVGFGAWQLAGEWGRSFTAQETGHLLGRAQEVGINLIDTAECYGDHLSESLIGQALPGRRQDWIIATKFGHGFGGHLKREDRWSPEEVLIQLEQSLKALRTDYVDLYQFHSGSDAQFDNPALWDMLAGQVKAGKIRKLGISISGDIKIHQTEGARAAGCGAIQTIYNRLDTRAEKEVFPSCLKQDLGVLARVPLARGFLSGKYKPGDESSFPDNDVRSSQARAVVLENINNAQKFKKEVPPGVEMSAWALAWCLKNPAVTCVIPGCKTPEQVSANAAAADLAE